MWPSNRVTERLHIQYPVIQAGMAGGATTPELVAAVSNAGGLGTLGAGYMSPEQLRQTIHAIQRLTDAPFAVNLFISDDTFLSAENIDYMNHFLDRYREELGIGEEPDIDLALPAFSEQLAVIIEEQVPVFSSTFGVPSQAVIEILRDRGIIVLGTATTVKEARLLEEQAVDMIVAQGSEAGGHRGTFNGDFAAAQIGTMALVPQIADHVHVPVIAAGGIMDGRGTMAAITLGAEGVQLGTAFLSCQESGAHAGHKEAVLHSTDESTVVTRAFSGKPARGIRNYMLQDFEAKQVAPLPYPVHNQLTKDIRRAAKEQNHTGYMSLWAGQAAALSRRQSAAVLVQRIHEQVQTMKMKMQT